MTNFWDDKEVNKLDSIYTGRNMVDEGGGSIINVTFRYHNSIDSLKQVKKIDSTGTQNFLKGWGKIK